MVKNVEADKNQNYNYIDISELLSRFFRELKKLWLPAIIVTAAFAALFAVRAITRRQSSSPQLSHICWEPTL